MESATTPWHQRFSPWIPILALISLWHNWRSVNADTWIFGVPTAILLLDAIRIYIVKPHARKQPHVALVQATAIGLWVILSFSARHGDLDRWVLGVLGVISFYVVWTIDVGRRPKITHLHKRANIAWSIAIVVFCIVEFTAYMLAIAPNGGDLKYPTLSVLLDPLLNQTPSRAVLVLLWLLLGIKILRLKVRS